MYRAYRINLTKKNEDYLKKEYEDYTNTINSNDLVEYILKEYEDFIEADSVLKTMFPSVKAQIFISHSSKDVNIARGFSNILQRETGITSFIDSDVWGHMDILLEKIIKKFGYSTAYEYQKICNAASHVHMLLSHALRHMIDSAECFIFLGTENSISLKRSIENLYSPWIFHEISTVNTIQIKLPNRTIPSMESINEAMISGSFNVHYPYNSARITNITMENFIEALSSANTSEEYLNNLYLNTHVG